MPYWSALLSGVEAKRVEILCKADPGRYTMSLMGNIRGVLREAAGIIPQALQSQGLPLPDCKVIVQLEPQEDIKDRASIELGVALAMLIEFLLHPGDLEVGGERLAREAKAGAGSDLGEDFLEEVRRERERIAQVEGIQDRDYFIIGGLDIFGNVRPVRGLLSMLYHAREGDVIIVPAPNEREAQLWARTNPRAGVEVFPVASLREAYETVLRQPPGPPLSRRRFPGFVKPRKVGPDVDFKDIVGQERAKRALEIAAAGGHHCLLYGPTGQGKSMLAKALRGVLPTLDPRRDMEEIKEINKIWSAKGLLRDGEIVLERPFREIGAGVTPAALLGGSLRGRDPEPGEISLAHRGVLFMDEIDKFDAHLIESLRAPLQERQHTVQRASGSTIFPCNFVLIAAMNPCQCSYFGEWECSVCHRAIPYELDACPQHTSAPLRHLCTCGSTAARRFPHLLSGPLRNRLHLKVRVYSPDKVLPLARKAEPSSTIRRRVEQARQAQAKRFAGQPDRVLNSDIVAPREIAERFDLAPEVESELRRIPKIIPARAPMRTKVVTFAVARTIADLEGSGKLRVKHLIEAVTLTVELTADRELRRAGSPAGTARARGLGRQPC